MRRPKDPTLKLQESEKAIQEALSAIVQQELPPALEKRVRALLSDLASNDLSLALLDLAHLYRAVMMVTNAPGRHGRAFLASEAPKVALIYADDETIVPERCNGPDAAGRCPRAGPRCPVACAGRWAMATGWSFRVALDAETCPLVALGVIRLEPRGVLNRRAALSA